ncbi:type IV secretory system conjugative DNA transfer family protein [Enterococcus raffinosus]|uniref:VirD4-like conjugal transfer protein, CD1115 family n=1 Tax=Enterococcus raffinosus TaxID=71452 RepID=UPI002890E860|nr:type IV secretory system conjugative DNA transfer family protein [Enterococcus raffinosus]MDT2525133.1 type IV secretory system conjugative DNA transfer family protein [Enterococcus raffinosus]MDT2592488.1 type IV secretory system conjugative DNA transfer family protein [Enterococcus raffinosus]
MFRKVRAFFKNAKDDKERFGNVTEHQINQRERGFLISLPFLILYIYFLLLSGIVVTRLLKALGYVLSPQQTLTLDLWNSTISPVFEDFRGQYLHILSPAQFWSQGLGIDSTIYKVYIIVMLVAGLGVFFKLTDFEFFRSRKINRKQLGNNRFMLDSEVMRNYTAIPDRDLPFEGIGGTAISHMPWYKVLFNFHFISFSPLQRLKVIKNMFHKVWGVYFIDRDFVNDLIIGITRSGKGEMFVFSIIDILSRAVTKTSMVVNDMKGELTRASYKVLKKRGYDVQVLNLSNLNKSMSYNPLALAIQLAKQKKFDEAQKEINSIAYTIFHDEKESNKYWQNSAMNLFNAIALAQILLAMIENTTNKNAFDKITIFNITDMLSKLGGEEKLYKMGNQIIKKNGLVEFFETLKDVDGVEEFQELKDLAVLQFSTSKFAGEEAQGNTFSTAMTGLKIYQQSDVAKLTSKNSIDLRKIGFPRNIYISTDNSDFSFEKATLTIKNTAKKNSGRIRKIFSSIIKSNSETISVMLDINGNGVVDLKQLLTDSGKLQVTIKGVKYEYTLEKEYKLTPDGTQKLDKWTKKPLIKGIKVTPNDEGGKNQPTINFDYSEKPVAVFLITPAYDSSYNQIVTSFINQTFSILGQACQNSIGGQCYTSVCYLLDEMANLPAIPDMKTKISICLGMKIKFVNILQNMEQTVTNYGREVSDTIKSNSGNTIYIFSNSVNTTEEISKRLGKRTIYVASASETDSKGKISGKGNRITNNLKEQDLLTPQQLSKFKNNENLVLTDMKRRDKKGYDIVQRPILNIKRKRMPYRYQLLGGTFNTDVSILDIDIDTPHLRMKLSENKFNYEELEEVLFRWNKGTDTTSIEESSDNTKWDKDILNIEEDESKDEIAKEPKEALETVSKEYFSQEEESSENLLNILFLRLNETQIVSEFEYPSLENIEKFRHIPKDEMNDLIFEVTKNEPFRKTMILNDLAEKNLVFGFEERS